MSADQTNTAEAERPTINELHARADGLNLSEAERKALWNLIDTAEWLGDSGSQTDDAAIILALVEDRDRLRSRIMELEKALEEIRTVDKSRITKILGEDGQYHAEDGPAGKIAARVLTEGRK